jgi:hypothetical protein
MYIFLLLLLLLLRLWNSSAMKEIFPIQKFCTEIEQACEYKNDYLVWSGTTVYLHIQETSQ